ncbi:MAG: RRXRR domain-containing protein, partial [Ruminococcus flavefaciens]|nr:RRXRR domain-containing protein [Ruminococcus flavefaciens]
MDYINPKEFFMHYVYVQDMAGNPLMPTTRYGKVRRMLKDGRAVAVRTKPFTIRLTYLTESHVVQEVTLGIDPGRTNIGLAAVDGKGRCLYSAKCETRNKQIPKLMEKRRMHRMASRRGERLARKRLAKRLGTTRKAVLERMLPGYGKPVQVKDIINTEARFNNRKRPEGWLTTTVTQLLRTHLNLVRLVGKVLPVSRVALELNR